MESYLNQYRSQGWPEQSKTQKESKTQQSTNDHTGFSNTPCDLAGSESPKSVKKQKYKPSQVCTFVKYKPIGVKVKPIKTELPQEFYIKREIVGDPLEGMPQLPTNLLEFTPGKQYTKEHKKIIDDNHPGDFL